MTAPSPSPAAMLAKALAVATVAHAGQYDKQGQPYILHVTRVVDRVRSATGKVVAALHDVMEDDAVAPVDASYLSTLAFGPDVILPVLHLTRIYGESYANYIRRVALNEVAVEVKLADLRDNLDRMTSAVDPTGSLRSRYSSALAYLRGDADAEPR